MTFLSINKAGQTLVEFTLSLFIHLALICASGALLYSEWKKITQTRIEFEKAHWIMIQEQLIPESVRTKNL